MPRFYFHIISDHTLLDDEGVNLADDKDALSHARAIAAELVRSTGAARGVVVVENEDDGGMFEVPLTSWNN